MSGNTREPTREAWGARRQPGPWARAGPLPAGLCPFRARGGASGVLGRGLKHLLVAAKPHWVQLIQDAEAAVQDALRWECRASGKPRPSYRWLKNGEALELEVRPAPAPCRGAARSLVSGKPGPWGGGPDLALPRERVVFVNSACGRAGPCSGLTPESSVGCSLLPCGPRRDSRSHLRARSPACM